jgi:hypothetical protein
MQNKLKIKYGGGEGGRWLSHLIFCLENNLSPQCSKNRKNFHENQGSSNVEIDHWPTEPYKFFGGNLIFNIYLNWVEKALWSHHVHPIKDMPIRDIFERLASYTSYKLELLDKQSDVSFDLILTDSKLFGEQLFNLLDNYQILYKKNQTIVDQAIKNFQNTCVDPMMHFNNCDSMYWLGWCNGISKHLWNDWPLVDSVQEMQDFVLLKKDFYCDFTKSHMIKL